MKNFDYTSFDATGLADLVARREVTPAELLDAAIERADAVNPKLNAVISRFDARARRRIDSEPLSGPFAGVPFLLKDFLQDYAGERSTYGNKGLKQADYRPDHNATLVDRFLAAGVVPFGHTNSPEFGFKGVTEPEAHGPTRNPWNLDHLPYGSSGGSASAVAAGIVPMAGASDGGGSIRLPASACGLFGFKPGRGRTPSGPDYAELMHGGAVSHVLTRTVRDSARMLDAIQGPEPGGPFAIAPPERPYAQELGRDPGRLKIGFCTRSPIGTPVDPDCVRAVTDTARLLESLGHVVEEAEPAIDGDALADDFLSVYFAMAGAAVAAVKEQAGCGNEGFELDTLGIAGIGRAISAPDYIAIHDRWNTYNHALADFHGRYDLYLTPTNALPPPRVGEQDTPAGDRAALRVILALRLSWVLLKTGYVHKMARRLLQWTPFTQLANLTGTPSMSLPLHWAATGLPIGVQIGAGVGGEGLLLRVASQLEQARPWADKRPPVFAA
jgi:amidase